MGVLLYVKPHKCLPAGAWGASTVEGQAGGSIIIKCRYDKKYTYNKKYFCKGYFCRREIYTGRQRWQNDKRFSVYDNEDEGYLKVIMRDLTKSDEGKYWCAVYINWQHDEYTQFNLKVRKGKSLLLFGVQAAQFIQILF